MAIELRLNPRKVGNYAFFCPVTKLHLTLTNPVGTTDRVSAYILRALKSKTLIDVNNVVDLETGQLDANGNDKSNTGNKENKTEPVKSETTVIQDQKEDTSSQVAEAAVENNNKKTNKRGKRAQANPVDEAAE